MDSNEYKCLLELKRKVWEKYKPGIDLRPWKSPDCKNIALAVKEKTGCIISDKSLSRLDKLKEYDSLDNNKTVQFLSMYILGEEFDNTSQEIWTYFPRFIRSIKKDQEGEEVPTIPIILREALIEYTLYMKYSDIVYSEQITISYKERKVNLQSNFFKMTFEGPLKISSGYLYIETWGQEKFKEDKRLDIWIYKGRNTIVQELDILEGILISSKNTGFPTYGEVIICKNTALAQMSKNEINLLKEKLKNISGKKVFGAFGLHNYNYLE